MKNGKLIFSDGIIVSCTIYNNDIENIDRILIWYHDERNLQSRYIIENRSLSDISKVNTTMNTGVYIWYIN